MAIAAKICRARSSSSCKMMIVEQERKGFKNRRHSLVPQVRPRTTTNRRRGSGKRNKFVLFLSSHLDQRSSGASATRSNRELCGKSFLSCVSVSSSSSVVRTMCMSTRAETVEVRGRESVLVDEEKGIKDWYHNNNN